MKHEEQNRKMATEVMGWVDQRNAGIDIGHYTNRDYTPGISYDEWQPHSNLSQALSVAKAICSANGWKWKFSNGSEYPGKPHVFGFWSKLKPFDKYPEGHGAEPIDAIYQALIAAIEKGEGE